MDIYSIRRDNVVLLVEQHGSQTALANAIERQQDYISGLLSSKRRLGEKLARKIERKLGLTLGAMDSPRLGRGVSGDEAPEPILTPTRSTSGTPAGYVRIPQYPAAGAGRRGGIEDYSTVIRHLDMAKEWAERNLPRNLQSIYALSARGDSMEPDIHDGDIVFVDTSQREFSGDGYYVLTVGDHTLVKRLKLEVSPKRLAIISANKDYAPEYVSVSEIDQVNIGGRVVAWWTLRKF